MKITIQGTDYTAALDASRPLTIERKLNEPSVCILSLSLPTNSSLTTPLRNQSLTITGDNGVVYFTGYIAVSPLPEYAGLALEGPATASRFKPSATRSFSTNCSCRPAPATPHKLPGLCSPISSHTPQAPRSPPAASPPLRPSAASSPTPVRPSARALAKSLLKPALPTVH